MPAGSDVVAIVQMRDPKTGRYIKVDRATGKVLRRKQTDGPYERIPIVESVRRQKARKFRP